MPRFRWNTVIFVLLILFGIGFIGVFFEEGASATRVVTFKGIFSEPATDWPMTQIFIGHLYGLLYSISESVPWYGIIDYSLALSGLLLLFARLQKLSSVWVVAAFLMLAFDDIVMFSFTRTSMLVVSGGLLSLHLLRKRSGFPFAILGLTLLAILGFCNRPQAFAYVTALFGIFVITDLIISEGRNAVVVGLRKVALPISACVLLAGIYFTTMPPDIRESQRLAPRFYNLFGGGFYDDVATLSKGDSLAIRLLQGNFVNDRNVFNEEFTDRVTQNTPREYFSFEKVFSGKFIQRALIKYGDFFGRHHLADIVVLLFLFLWLLSVWIARGDRRFLWIAGYLLVCVLSLLFITLIVKMELRISSPLFLFAYVSSFILLSRTGLELPNGKWLSMAVIIPVAIGSVVIGKKLYEASARYQNFVEQNIIITNAINERFDDHTVVVSNPGLRLFSRLPFQEFNNSGTNSFKSYEGEAIIYMPTMQRMIREFSGTLEMADFYATMYNRRDSVVYLANDEWVDLMLAYLEHHYGVRYVFGRLDVPELDAMDTHRPVSLYRPESRVILQTEN